MSIHLRLKLHQRHPDRPDHGSSVALENATTAAEAARSALQSSAAESLSEEFGRVSLFRRIFISKLEVSRLLGKAREIEMKTVSGLFDVVNSVDAVRFNENRHNEILIFSGNQEVNPAVFLLRPVMLVNKLMIEWMGYVSERKRKLIAIPCFTQSGSIGLLFKISHILRHAANFLIAHFNTPFNSTGSGGLSMFERFHTETNMAAAELIIGETLSASASGVRHDSVMRAYWHTPAERRDAFVAILTARLTLVPPFSTPPAGAAA